jgi:hypothetical protein
MAVVAADEAHTVVRVAIHLYALKQTSQMKWLNSIAIANIKTKTYTAQHQNTLIGLFFAFPPQIRIITPSLR